MGRTFKTFSIYVKCILYEKHAKHITWSASAVYSITILWDKPDCSSSVKYDIHAFLVSVSGNNWELTNPK
jgi:hypothetical protein